MNKIKLGILQGGSSVEREISFKSADNILNNIDKNKYDIIVYNVPENKDNLWIEKLISDKPDIVLSALHGGKGENGVVQGLLQCLCIPYVGSKVTGSAICMNKLLSKQLMEFNHIPVIEGFCVLKEHTASYFYDEAEKIGYPLIVKPNRGGSSIGISVVYNQGELLKAIEYIREKYNDDALVEKYIIGQEVTCGVIQTGQGLKVMSVLDINAEGDIYDYESKYVKEKSSVSFTKLPQYMQIMIEEIAKKAFCVLKCSGYGCVDMIISQEQVYVIEINTLPGMTLNSLIPAAAKGVGMTLGEFLDELIAYELNLER